MLNLTHKQFLAILAKYGTGPLPLGSTRRYDFERDVASLQAANFPGPPRKTLVNYRLFEALERAIDELAPPRKDRQRFLEILYKHADAAMARQFQSMICEILSDLENDSRFIRRTRPLSPSKRPNASPTVPARGFRTTHFERTAPYERTGHRSRRRRSRRAAGLRERQKVQSG
jgi:hypothetical protein